MSDSDAPRPFDPGLQAERTSLAWTRTALSIVAGSLVAARVLPGRVGDWILIPALLALAASMLLIWWAHRRYRAVTASLAREGLRAPIANGLLPGVLAAVVVIIGVVSIFVAVNHEG